jgi:hypothetical protein
MRSAVAEVYQTTHARRARAEATFCSRFALGFLLRLIAIGCSA